MPGLPRGFEASDFDVQELNFRINTQLILLQSENFFVMRTVRGRVFRVEKFLHPGYNFRILIFKNSYFLFQNFNLL